jgi:hypothetical protein
MASPNATTATEKTTRSVLTSRFDPYGLHFGVSLIVPIDQQSFFVQVEGVDEVVVHIFRQISYI